MPPVPAKISDRIANGLKRFQAILASAKSRDLGESDTVTVVVDILAEVFGYDKYAEVTSEHAIRGTFCDLAVKLDGVLQWLLEVKAVGLELKDQHVKQAIDYAANQGVDWVLLTNGMTWRVYKVTFAKPIDQELVLEFDFCSLSHKAAKDIETLFLISKEGWGKSLLGDYHNQKQALSRFFIGAMVLSDAVVDVVRRELRRVSPDVKVDSEEIRNVLISEVIKREVLEGDKADEAKRRISRSAGKPLRTRANKAESSDGCDAPAETTPPAEQPAAEAN